MIQKMTAYAWILLSGEREGFLQSLQELGVVDITRSSKPVDEESARLVDSIEDTKALIKTLKSGSDAHLEALKASRAAILGRMEEVAPWGEWDAEAMDALGVPFHFHCLRAKDFDPGWAERCALEVIYEGEGKVYFVVAGDNAGVGGEVPRPEATARALKARSDALGAEADAYAAALEARRAEIPALEQGIAQTSSALSLHLAGVTGESAAEGSIVVYRGFAPSESDADLAAAFDAMDLYWTSREASADDNPPINFRNNRFVRMFEPLTDMYGRPAYDGFDPTPYISIFFLLFFAMCMGDMGYGIVLIIAGVLLRKVRSFASLAPLVCTLGVGTVAVGFFFHTFFSVDIASWEWIPEGVKAVFVPSTVAGYDGTMVLALAVGVVHLLLAMIVKTVYATRNAGFLESLSTWGWTLFWVGLTVIGVLALCGVLSSPIVRIAIIVLGIVCAIGIFPLNNIHRNPLVNVGSGLWDTYNMATGILGDVLSYLRLYALGLAGAMLGFAFNDLAAMALGDGGLGWVFFILIVIIGHTLNLAMAALGAFVHPLRLNFLEFFKNSDYQGVGRKYDPLRKQ